METLKALEVSYIEISAGSVTIPHEEKCAYIEYLSDSFDVLSEVGSKDTDTTLSPAEWRRRCQNELDAGATYVFVEGRASGRAGIYKQDGEVKDSIVKAITDGVPLEKLIFEAPLKQQQAWFINRFGPDVNLGNIFATDVLKLQTLRLGLRGDTLQTIHGQTDHD